MWNVVYFYISNILTFQQSTSWCCSSLFKRCCWFLKLSRKPNKNLCHSIQPRAEVWLSSCKSLGSCISSTLLGFIILTSVMLSYQERDLNLLVSLWVFALCQAACCCRQARDRGFHFPEQVCFRLINNYLFSPCHLLVAISVI